MVGLTIGFHQETQGNTVLLYTCLKVNKLWTKVSKKPIKVNKKLIKVNKLLLK